jgi:hypothetical protein
MNAANPENRARKALLLFTVPAWGFVVALSLESIRGLAWSVFSTSAQKNKS